MHAKIVLLFLTTFFIANVAVAQGGIPRAIRLYNEGKYSEAIVILRANSKLEKRNAELWYYLGLAYSKTNNFKGAMKALRKAVKYDRQNLTYRANLSAFYISMGDLRRARKHYDHILKSHPQNHLGYFLRGTVRLAKGQSELALLDAEETITLRPRSEIGYTLKSDAYLTILGREWLKGKASAYIGKARETLNRYLKGNPQGSVSEEFRQRLASLDSFAEYFRKKEKGDAKISNTGNRYTGLQVTKKASPGYTDKARVAGTSGKVVLLVEFRMDGKIGQILVLKGLPNGLTQKAVAAARRVQFKPATKDGNPRTVVKLVHFKFYVF